MNQSYCLKLLLLLLLHNDVERAFTDASPSYQCKSNYCINEQTPTTPEVRFTDRPRPATLAIGCLGRQIDLICCTANFARISWQRRVDGSTWTDFLSLDPENRCLSESNQTASIGNLRRQHEGLYRCIAYGHGGDVISNEVKLVAQDCFKYHQPPYPLKRFTKPIEVSVGDHVHVMCIGFFGNLKTCSVECDIGWIRHPFNLTDFDPVSQNASARVYAQETTHGVDQMLSRLHISQVTDDDFRGSYECWMVNQQGFTNSTIVRFKPESRGVVVPIAYTISAFVCGGALVFAACLSVVLWPFRHHIQLAQKRKRKRQTPPSSTDLDYDVLLLHAESVETTKFEESLRERLAEYRVHSSGLNVLPGQNIPAAVGEALMRSRCAVVVLCPAFVAEYNEDVFCLLCRHCLQNCITEIDVIYVLCGGLDVGSSNDAISESIRASIRNSLCLTWPARENAWLGLKHKLKVASFWCRLELAILNSRRTPNVNQSPPAAATIQVSRQSSENDSLLETASGPNFGYTRYNSLTTA